MQALGSPWLNVCKLFGVVTLCLFTHACGWERTMAFPSPSRTSFIEIWQRESGIHPHARVELVTGNRRTVLYTQPTEAFIYFVHVYWSKDETRVGVLATGMVNIDVAANARTGSSIPFDQIRTEFAQSLRDTYNIPSGELDPIAWAAMSEAQHAFSRLHPEIRPR